MRYSASEKHEIIRTVEDSALGIKRTCVRLGINRSTFYNWYDRYLSGGVEALEDKKPVPGEVWNKVPEAQCKALLDMALDEIRSLLRNVVKIAPQPFPHLRLAVRRRIIDKTVGPTMRPEMRQQILRQGHVERARLHRR